MLLFFRLTFQPWRFAVTAWSKKPLTLPSWSNSGTTWKGWMGQWISTPFSHKSFYISRYFILGIVRKWRHAILDNFDPPFPCHTFNDQGLCTGHTHFCKIGPPTLATNVLALENYRYAPVCLFQSQVKNFIQNPENVLKKKYDNFKMFRIDKM